MGQFVVEGGRRLAGTFNVSGAKNAALPILAATTMVPGPVALHRVPLGLSDVQHMLAMLRDMGAVVREVGSDTVVVDTSRGLDTEVPELYTRMMRASVFLMGPIVARFGRVSVARPGGCDIGTRPIDLHLKGLSALGARVDDGTGGQMVAVARHLRGTSIYLDFPSVGATENVMMAAILADGETIIDNAAREPEVVDLAQFLNAMGGEVRGAGTDRIRVTGRPGLLSGGSYELIGDRIEAGTVAVAAAATQGDVEVVGLIPEHLNPLWRKLTEMGVEIAVGTDQVRIRRTGPLSAVSLRTGPHPGFPTDLQPLLLVLMTQAVGCSTLVETVFENRLRHAEELRRMGANVLTDGRLAVIYGPSRLAGAVVEATDLRAGAALMVAGMAAEGTTTVLGAELVARGYQQWAERLSALGASVRGEND